MTEKRHDPKQRSEKVCLVEIWSNLFCPSYGQLFCRKANKNCVFCLSPTWYPKQQFFNGCFSWTIPNLYIKNCCFTKHPFLTGCLGFQVGIQSPCQMMSKGCTSSPPKRKVFRFHETILSFGEPGSLGKFKW